jgi:hypothetical protein
VAFMPIYSPDLNKPIEHAHANTGQAFRDAMLARNRRGEHYVDVQEMVDD